MRRGRPRLGIRGGRQQQVAAAAQAAQLQSAAAVVAAATHGNSPSRGDWLPLDMRTTPPAMPAFRGFDDSVSADGVVSLLTTFDFLLDSGFPTIPLGWS